MKPRTAEATDHALSPLLVSQAIWSEAAERGGGTCGSQTNPKVTTGGFAAHSASRQTRKLRVVDIALFALLLHWLSTPQALALSIGLASPQILFPKNYDTNRTAQIESVLQNKSLKYLNGLTSLWEPEFSTTLVYGGDAEALNDFLAAMNKVAGVNVRITFSKDLSKETGSALSAGSWWVIYSHTIPDTITVRINLAAEAFSGDKLEVRLPKQAVAGAASSSRTAVLDTGAILIIARQAVGTNDTWLDRAEFEMPKRQTDGSGWSVHVWRLPKTPGGDRLIIIDEKGQVTRYLRGH